MSVIVGSVNKSLPSHKDITRNGESEAGPSSSNELCRKLSKDVVSNTQQGEEQHGADGGNSDGGDEDDFVLGPMLPLKEQLEKDKEDESLRKWKEKLLGCIQLDGIEDGVDPEFKVLSLSILSEGGPRIVINFPLLANGKKAHLFTLKEGASYNLKFTFSLRRNIVSGLTYVHTVWKNGLRVDHSRVMLGTFAPEREPHTVVMEEETTPSGIWARGNYTAKTKFIDDDGRCHFEMQHTFDIRKEW